MSPKRHYALAKSSREKLLAKYQQEYVLATKKDLERALAQSNERFEIIARATSDAIYDFDIHAGKLVWSEALHIHYGYPKNEKADRLEWWTSHIHPDDAMQFEASITDMVESSKEAGESEYRFQKADGSYAYVRDRSFIQRDEKGQPVRLIGSLLDITKQKQLEQAKDEFISLVSHQLRTPLTSVLLFNEMLVEERMGKLTPLQKEYAEKAASSARRMIELVGNILNVSRIELGELQIKPAPTDIDRLILAYIEELKPVAAAKKVRLSFTSSGLGKVPVDPTLFGQIIHNLVSNAIRYSPPRGGKVLIAFAKKKDAYQLSVRDSGIGIPAGSQERIFERFFRADNAAKAESGGSGLGLYLIKLISESSGGKVWFESVEGQGTTFYVTFPLDGMHGSRVITARL
jgi:two-component system, chemotaxis family, CheB/CheR fusion protein